MRQRCSACSPARRDPRARRRPCRPVPHRAGSRTNPHRGTAAGWPAPSPDRPCPARCDAIADAAAIRARWQAMPRPRKVAAVCGHEQAFVLREDPQAQGCAEARQRREAGRAGGRRDDAAHDAGLVGGTRDPFHGTRPGCSDELRILPYSTTESSLGHSAGAVDLTDLRRIESVLARLVRDCDDVRGKVSCPLIGALQRR
jgi:hypothetical protein